MPGLKTITHTLGSADFWTDAAVIIVGYKGSDFINGFLGSKLAFLPKPVVPFVGPVVVILLGGMVGEKHGRNLKLGAMVNAANTILGMAGIKAL